LLISLTTACLLIRHVAFTGRMTATGRNVKVETLTYFKALFQHFPGGPNGEGELP